MRERTQQSYVGGKAKGLQATAHIKGKYVDQCLSLFLIENYVISVIRIGFFADSDADISRCIRVAL